MSQKKRQDLTAPSSVEAWRKEGKGMREWNEYINSQSEYDSWVSDDTKYNKYSLSDEALKKTDHDMEALIEERIKEIPRAITVDLSNRDPFSYVDLGVTQKTKYEIDDEMLVVGGGCDLRTNPQALLEQTKQNKPDLSLAPTFWLEIAGQALIIGAEKGYRKHSWMEPGQNRSKWLSALKRHLIKYESGETEYTEYKANGTPCEQTANHLYAIAFNALAAATSYYLGRHEEDDRPIIQGSKEL